MESSKTTETTGATGGSLGIPPGPVDQLAPDAGAASAGGEADTAPIPTVAAPVPAPAAPGATGPAITPSLAPSGADRCPACGSPAAPDQRYCVECGQRLAQARPLRMGGGAGSGGGGSEPPLKRRGPVRLSANATLIAGIATLILAMGVGVVIGRLDNGSGSKGGTTYIPTVVQSGAAGAAASTEQAAAASGSQTPKPAAAGATKGTATKPAAAVVKPSNPTVKIGDAGHGRGYQHGHFTGHFFGEENENEESNEASSGATTKSKGTKK